MNSVFLGLNIYLGNYIGEFLGELTMNTWFLTIGLVLVMMKGKIKYFGYFALITAVLGYIGGFRNVTQMVSMIAEVNNYLLPLFLVSLGVLLLRAKKEL